MATLADIVARYLLHAQATGLFCAESLTERRRTFEKFVTDLGDLHCDVARRFHLTDWIEAHAGWHSSSTRKAKANQINAVFNWAVREGRIVANPFRYVNYPEAEPRQAMGDESLDQICRLANKRFERAILFLRFTGCRLSELCRLRWPMVDLARGLIVYDQHKSRRKTGRSKIVVLVPECVDLLVHIRKEQAAEYRGVIFLNNRDRPWTRRTLGQQLRRMKARGQVATDATLHGIRHQFGTVAVANGAPIKLVSQALGHASSAITERYYVHLGERDADAVRAAAQLAQPKKREREF